jgi:hypothetical protein
MAEDVKVEWMVGGVKVEWKVVVVANWVVEVKVEVDKVTLVGYLQHQVHKVDPN